MTFGNSRLEVVVWEIFGGRRERRATSKALPTFLGAVKGVIEPEHVSEQCLQVLRHRDATQSDMPHVATVLAS